MLSVRLDDNEEECSPSSSGAAGVPSRYGASGRTFGTGGCQGCAFCSAFGLIRP